MVAIYDIDSINNNVGYISPNVFNKWSCFKDSVIQFPNVLIENYYNDINIKYTSLYNDYGNKGVMLTNIETGDRTAFINLVYDNLKTIRGNNANLLFQYICLLKTNKVTVFLRHFPQYTNLFHQFYYKYTGFIKNIHDAYICHYVLKKDVKISKQFFFHIYRIHHSIYIPSLQSDSRVKITKSIA